MSFPANPVDGQRHKQYLYNESIGAWDFEPNFLDGLPVGIALPFYGVSEPPGWLRLPRQAKRISRTQYKELWDIFGNEDWFAPDSSAAGTASANGEFHLPTVEDAYIRSGIHGTVTSVDDTNNVLTIDDEEGVELTSSELRDGSPFRFRSSGSLPGGITDAYTTYYLHWDSGNSGWSLHTTEQDAIDDTSRTDLTSSGSGTITATQYGVNLGDVMQRITGKLGDIWLVRDFGDLGGAFTGTKSGDDRPGIGSNDGSYSVDLDSRNSPGAKTSNESRGRTAYGRYIIKAESATVDGNPASAFKYDTGWVANSDWTNAELSAVHNLNAPLSELIVHFFISTDGTDANSFELKDYARIDVDATSSNTNDGFAFYHVSDNEFKVQTGEDGIIQLDDNGVANRIDTESWYYRIVVYKPQFAFSGIKTVPTRTVTGNYTIGAEDATTILADASGGPITVTLPLLSDVENGDKRKVYKTDSSSNDVTVQRQDSDTIGPGSLTSITLSSEDEASTFTSDNGKWMSDYKGGAAIANAQRVVAEYQLKKDQELDYTTEFGSTGTKTISELPSNTTWLCVYIEVSRGGDDKAIIQFKRNSSDTQRFDFESGKNNTGGTSSAYRGIIWVPSDGNTVYIDSIFDTVADAKIVGYKVGES